MGITHKQSQSENTTVSVLPVYVPKNSEWNSEPLYTSVAPSRMGGYPRSQFVFSSLPPSLNTNASAATTNTDMVTMCRANMPAATLAESLRPHAHRRANTARTRTVGPSSGSSDHRFWK